MLSIFVTPLPPLPLSIIPGTGLCSHSYPSYLFIDENVSIEPVTPTTIIITPPEKLVLEIKTTGRFWFIQWRRNADPLFLPNDAPNFVHFGDIYYTNMTTMQDLGIYEAVLEPDFGGTGIQYVMRIAFAVFPRGIAVLCRKCQLLCIIFTVSPNTSAITKEVAIFEGRNVNISCASSGVPVPTISWHFNDMVAPFNHTDTFTNFSAFAYSSKSPPVITYGRTVSNLQLKNIQYPAHNGVYVCVGSNSHKNVVTVSSANISVIILGTHSCTMLIQW